MFLYFFAASNADTCDTTNHPSLNIRGTCIDQGTCTSQGGQTLNNWCESKPANVKCCFKPGELTLFA